MSEADRQPSALGDPSDSSPECALEPSLSPWLAAVQLVEQIVLMDDTQLWLLAAVCFLIGFVSACQPSRQAPRQSGSCRDEVAAAIPGGGDSRSVARDVAPATAAVPRQRPRPHGKQSVRELLVIHRDAVEKLRLLVSTHPHFKPERHDGLWLLRYLLSHKLRVPAAAAAAR